MMRMDETTQPIRWYTVTLEIGSLLPRNEAITAALEALRAAGFGAEADGDQFDLLCVECGKPITGDDNFMDDEQGHRVGSAERHRECPE